MPLKRKHQPPNKDGFIMESPYSKRPRRSATNQSELAQVVLDIIKDHEDEYNHKPSDTFMKLPSKRYNAEYYDKVSDPVDLAKIGQRIKADEYRDIEILTTDIQLMISNAKMFYEESSQEYIDACALWELYLNTKAKVLDESQNASKSSDSNKAKSMRKDIEITMDDLRDLYDSLVTESDDNGCVIADMFMQLPDREANAQYYEIIKEPIDFVTIGDKLEEGQYQGIAELKKDVLLLVKNARNFNEPQSQIYKDAVTIKNLFREKTEELEKSKKPGFVGLKLSARVKNRKTTVRESERLHEKSLTKQQSPEMKQELHDASILVPREDDYQALLYNEIVNYKNQLGHTICDPFVRLPNKRFYPMYYDDIENPISLKMIRKKIQTKKYENCDEMSDDFHLLFSNAKQFNIGSSQIHKDASTLQKLLESKLSEYVAKEEEDMEEMSGSEEEDMEEELSQDTEKTGDDTPMGSGSTLGDDEPGIMKKKRRRRRRKSAKESLQNRLQLLYNTLMEAEDDGGREMITLFLEKPSRKDYPDYYKLVLEPIDMKMIDKKIRHDKYFSVDDMLEDFNLMFNNARHYNEPGSEVYSDADALEKLLLAKNDELGPLSDVEALARTPRASQKPHVSDLEEKLEKLFTSVRDYVDPTNRKICEIFMHLPTKQVLPDYYKVIKKPIDMDRIQTRMQTGQYMKLDEMLADLLLMFENACLYNEPGSLIYIDALILQKMTVDSYCRLEKIEDILSPKHLVQEMLISLFMSVINHQDESGRCYSESFTTTPSSGESATSGDASKTQEAVDETKENKPAATSPLTFEVIKKNLHNRRYRRLDVFQEHMFEVFEEARNNNRTDSEVYEDAVELQKFFIKIRDELCKNGETLLSPALSLTVKRLENEFEAEKKEKQPEESKEDDRLYEEGKDLRENLDLPSQADGIDHDGIVYKPGDFVYIENPDNPGSPHIVSIVKLYSDESGQQMLYGVWLYRPEATFHMASKKFFVKEVFKSDYYNAVPVSLIQGKCFVMLSRDYFKLKPVGFKEEDVYVAESRYASKSKSFKRLKLNQWPHNPTELVPRDSPLPVIRISSCYSEQKVDESSTLEKMQTMLMHKIEDSWPTDVIDVERKNIVAEGIVSGEAKHYIQYRVDEMWAKIGDCVYLRQANHSALPKIARIERLWTDGAGKVWFEGPWFIRPDVTEHEPTRMFYKNELFISCSETTFSFDDVTGKCVVLYGKDYFACRPTELPEKDVYLFESKYIQAEKLIKKIKSAKRYAPSFKICSNIFMYDCRDDRFFEDFKRKARREAVDDEYYYYKRPLVTETVVSPHLVASVEKELKSRENEALMMKTKQEVPDEVPTTSVLASTVQPPPPMPAQQQAYPPGPPVFAQPPMLPGQPYPHYPHPGAPAYPASTAPIDPLHPIPQVSPYPQQPYTQVARYSSPHPGVPQHHVGPPPPFQNPPQMYAAGPHAAPPMVMTPSPTIQSPDNSRPSSARPDAAPTPPTKRRGRSGHSTGYILFASHCHPRVRAEHPEMPFGEISKIVGEEWRGLSDEKKKEFEEKAKEQTAKAEAEGRLFKKKKRKKDTEEHTPQTPAVATPQQHPPPGAFAPTPEQGWQHRMPMAHHPGAVPSQYPVASYVQTPVGQAYAPQQGVPQPPIPPPPPSLAQQHRMKRGPLFVSPPPKAQRIMHSEAYLRYIEGLEKGSKSISNWEKTLNATEKDIRVAKEEDLPLHWLGNGKGRHETATSALWALRNLMLKDALTIKNSFNC